MAAQVVDRFFGDVGVPDQEELAEADVGPEDREREHQLRKIVEVLFGDQALEPALAPRFARLTAKWYVRGGLFTTVIAEHRKKGWKPPLQVDLGRIAVEGTPTRG